MYKSFIILIAVFFILNQTHAKNSTKSSPNSKPSIRVTKQKDQNRLPNRQGSLTRDPIFAELLNNKPGPPRRKRVRTILPTPDLSFPSVLIPNWHAAPFARTQMSDLLYYNPYIDHSRKKDMNNKNQNGKGSNQKKDMKKKDQNRLPNRQGTFSQDPIFGELSNKNKGPPRRKRVEKKRMVVPAFHLSVPTMSYPNWHGHPLMGTPISYFPYSNQYYNEWRATPLPYQRMQMEMPPPIRPTGHVLYSAPISSQPRYLFSKCAGLEEFPQTLSKLAAQFGTLDENHDGILSQSEWERDILKQLENTKSGISKMFVHSVFDLVDKDGNSAMDFYELLRVADLGEENKDGAINRVEFELFWLKTEVSGGKPLLQSTSSESAGGGTSDLNVMSAAFDLLDLDKNNKFSYTEFLQLDLDRDGEIGFLEFYYFLLRLSLDDGLTIPSENAGDNIGADYVSKWLKEANKLPITMLKLSFTSFDQADADFNGGLDSLEYLRLKEGVIIAYSQESHKLLFDLNDMNGDGFITVEEKEALLSLAQKQEEEIQKKTQEEESDMVKFGEYRHHSSNRKEGLPRLILNSDTNGDGKISKQEYIAQSEANMRCHINENNIQLVSDVLSFDMTITF